MVDLSKRRFFSRKKLENNELHLPWLSQPGFFTDQCTRCGKCSDACETQIIVKGDGGFPQVDFSVDECTFCYQCAEVCPEPLFSSKNEQPWNVKATINESCLAKQNVDCRSCSDMCEPMAITFKLEVGKVAQPNINLDECNGCGACVSVCPTSSINVSNL
ncbi:ferredoxin-type protein NapF [Vibrio sp. Isolate25]|uniref:ferredoxin-type protein NapF n=1 Tax=Vibrio TaxID=662 RepID=UPI001EFE9655|nr:MULTISPECIES: ferredoxin-type protein NapF [Vibrio]MCG9595653.1 ferredoxin-type protein NapF [Vibrio sp. Isolate25]MCG9677150.1 ferredoxin-type protein NapF [Vibrio sp. Isolate24]USD34203.1 ferredoxin-type protein NapF [Vibrio sp. SCSIO 43186]USD47275.1 ferredoxin-type protein NapF [Vibrio sp. SCSIO 43145]USD71327.1 ferredoxin-type protein NapF [Vibrio sp. SCSIO 43139]